MATMSVDGEDITQQEYENEADRGLDPRAAVRGLPDHQREEDPKAQKDRAASVAPRDTSRIRKTRAQSTRYSRERPTLEVEAADTYGAGHPVNSGGRSVNSCPQWCTHNVTTLCVGDRAEVVASSLCRHAWWPLWTLRRGHYQFLPAHNLSMSKSRVPSPGRGGRVSTTSCAVGRGTDILTASLRLPPAEEGGKRDPHVNGLDLPGPQCHRWPC
ncbi:hypothetical protein MRX96_038969 [Rhipicephalus microplus]